MFANDLDNCEMSYYRIPQWCSNSCTKSCYQPQCKIFYFCSPQSMTSSTNCDNSCCFKMFYGQNNNLSECDGQLHCQNVCSYSQPTFFCIPVPIPIFVPQFIPVPVSCNLNNYDFVNSASHPNCGSNQESECFDF